MVGVNKVSTSTNLQQLSSVGLSKVSTSSNLQQLSSVGLSKVSTSSNLQQLLAVRVSATGMSSIEQQSLDDVANSEINYPDFNNEIFCVGEETLVHYLSAWAITKCAKCIECQKIVSRKDDDHYYSCKPESTFLQNKRYNHSPNAKLKNPVMSCLVL